MTAAILTLLALLLVAPAASAQGLFRADDLVVYDSTGKAVGALAHAGSHELVFRTGAGRTVFVVVTRSSLSGSADLYFPEPGCRSTPYLTRGYSGRQPTSFVGGPRQSVYVSEGPFFPAQVQSTLTPDGRCVESPWTPEIARAVPAGVDLADYFTPPFELRATPGEPIPTGAVAEPLDSTDRLVVYDSSGKKVGATIAGGPYGTGVAVVAVVTASGTTLLLDVGDSALGGKAAAYFESTDCTGEPFMQVSSQSLVLETTVIGSRRAVYAPSAPATRRTMFSVDYGSGGCRILRERFTSGRTGAFAPTAPLGIELADYFTPPFTVRAGRGTRPLPRP